jgi:hypothetical protein
MAFKKALTKSTKTPASKPTKADALYISIDFPREGETIKTTTYGIRVSASAGYKPEIAIDGYDWKPCRPAVGFWWFDWANYPMGPHTIEARMLDGQKLLKKVQRSCTCSK